MNRSVKENEAPPEVELRPVPGRTTAPSPAPIVTAVAGPRALSAAETSTRPSTTSAAVRPACAGTQTPKRVPRTPAVASGVLTWKREPGGCGATVASTRDRTPPRTKSC